MTLNQETGGREWQTPLERQEFEHGGEMYRVKTADGDLVVSPEHRIYVKIGSYEPSLTSNPSSSTVNNLPLNSLTSDKRDDKDATSFSALGGCITKTIMPEYSLGGNKEVLRKSESRETIMALSLFAKDANLPLEMPLGVYSASNPFDISNFLRDLGIFSSSRNFESDMMFSLDKPGSIIQGSANHLPSQAGIFFHEILNTFSGREQFNDVTYQNPSAFESRLAMTNLTVCDDILINFNPHNETEGRVLFKDFALLPIKEVYSSFNENKEIYFMDENNVPEGTAFWSGNSEGYSQDVFDLRVVGGSVEFEHIIDPTVNLLQQLVTAEWRNLSATDTGNWVSTTNVFGIAYDSNNDLVYTGLDSGLIVGTIKFEENGVVYAEVPVIINTRSKNFLFDVRISVPLEFIKLEVGGNLFVDVEIIQIGPREKVDVVANYVIKDFSGNTLLEESETFFVLGEKTFSKELITSALEPGKYVIGLEIVYPGAFAVSSDQFEILTREEFEININILIIISAILMIIVSVIVVIWAVRKKPLIKNEIRKRR